MRRCRQPLACGRALVDDRRTSGRNDTYMIMHMEKKSPTRLASCNQHRSLAEPICRAENHRDARRVRALPRHCSPALRTTRLRVTSHSLYSRQSQKEMKRGNVTVTHLAAALLPHFRIQTTRSGEALVSWQRSLMHGVGGTWNGAFSESERAGSDEVYHPGTKVVPQSSKHEANFELNQVTRPVAVIRFKMVPKEDARIQIEHPTKNQLMSPLSSQEMCQ